MIVKVDENDFIRQHLRKFFAGHACEEHQWVVGDAADEVPWLRVAEFAPGPKSELWVYATIGAWQLLSKPRLEFVIVAARQDLRQVELASLAAWYHGKERLGMGHTLSIGEPWLPGSTCDCFLVSRPYPFGPDLEVCESADNPTRILWLLPITAAEREFAKREGFDALEEKFDACDLEYWDPTRASVV